MQVLALPREGREIPSFPPFIIDTLCMGMSDDNEIQSLTISWYGLHTSFTPAL